jgi:hypothetical protein
MELLFKLLYGKFALGEEKERERERERECRRQQVRGGQLGILPTDKSCCLYFLGVYPKLFTTAPAIANFRNTTLRNQ